VLCLLEVASLSKTSFGGKDPDIARL
jgi:hypothetical protein